jgi:hypothetical protein
MSRVAPGWEPPMSWNSASAKHPPKIANGHQLEGVELLVGETDLGAVSLRLADDLAREAERAGRLRDRPAVAGLPVVLPGAPPDIE